MAPVSVGDCGGAEQPGSQVRDRWKALPKGWGQPMALLLQLMETEMKKRCQAKDLHLLEVVKLEWSLA